MIRRFIKSFLSWVYLRIDWLVSTQRCSISQSGVALVRLDAIGDFVIWLDSAKEYKRLYPGQKITLIANAAWADLAQTMPYWDVVWPVKVCHLGWLQPVRRWQLLRQVRKANFDTAIQPTCSRLLLYGDSVIRATRARQRIGSVGDLANASSADREIGNRWYTQLLPATTDALMELERNAEFVSQLTGLPYQVCLPRLPNLIKLPLELQPTVPYFILFPGASWSGKRWPITHFAETLRTLHSRHGWLPVLCGAANEKTLCQAIVDASSLNCLNLAGRTSLLELTEVIRGARLLVGNDTSAVHLATAVATPSVCILGGGHFGRFVPYPAAIPGVKPRVVAAPMPCYNCNWHCNQPHESNGPVPCIANVTVSDVVEAAQQSLNESAKHAVLTTKSKNTKPISRHQINPAYDHHF